jgi:hypothetical protein
LRSWPASLSSLESKHPQQLSAIFAPFRCNGPWNEASGRNFIDPKARFP